MRAGPNHAQPGLCPIPQTYRPAFAHAANDTGLPLAMLVAIGRLESNLTPDARSTGAPTQETLDYVANVTSLWRKLRGCR